LVASTEEPQGHGAALTEFGLPYAADAAITRHLAHFLHRQSAVPTHVLFNGGVLRAAVVRQRLLEVLNSWLPKPVVPLASDDLMHAVVAARLLRPGSPGQRRSRAGGCPGPTTSVETPMPAVPGLRPPVKALTVVPFGMEEGTSHTIASVSFGCALAIEHNSVSSNRLNARRTTGRSSRRHHPDMEEMAPVEATLAGNPG
jgi:hypothetical protein